MAKLLQHQIVLDMVDPYPDIKKGVRFASPHASSTEVTLDVTRWMEMGHPRQITVTIHPGVRTDVDHGNLTAPTEPVCTCGPGKETVAHNLFTEAHYVGCPRWGTPLDPRKPVV